MGRRRGAPLLIVAAMLPAACDRGRTPAPPAGNVVVVPGANTAPPIAPAPMIVVAPAPTAVPSTVGRNPQLARPAFKDPPLPPELASDGPLAPLPPRPPPSAFTGPQ